MEFPETIRQGPLAPHKIAAQQQDIRDHIRQEVKGLPPNEAAMFRALLDRSENAIKIKKNIEAEQVFPWDKLSGEIQNMILRELLVTPQLIEPSIERPRHAPREWHKYDLGSSVLTVNNAMHEAALPILLGENTFVLNNDFNYILGKGTKRSKLRGALIRKIIVSSKMKPRMRSNLKKLTNLKEVTIVDKNRSTIYQSHTKSTREAKIKEGFNDVDEAVKAKIANSPKTTFNFVSTGIFIPVSATCMKLRTFD